MNTVLAKLDNLINSIDQVASSKGQFVYHRVIIIGDVHGCLDELVLLLSKLEHNPARDRIYFVGDFVAKGPKSHQVVDFIRSLPNTFAVMGNHDCQLLKCCSDSKHYPSDLDFIPEEWVKCFFPTEECPEHLKLVETMSLSDISYLHQLPCYLLLPLKMTSSQSSILETDAVNEININLVVVHAGVMPGYRIHEQEKRWLMNLRNVNVIEKQSDNNIDVGARESAKIKYMATAVHSVGVPWFDLYDAKGLVQPQSGVDTVSHVFYGHDSKRGLQVLPYVTGLDTGCAYGGKLTAAVVKCDAELSKVYNEKEINQFESENWEKNAKTLKSSGSGLILQLVQVDALKSYCEKSGPKVVQSK